MKCDTITNIISCFLLQKHNNYCLNLGVNFIAIDVDKLRLKEISNQYLVLRLYLDTTIEMDIKQQSNVNIFIWTKPKNN